MSKHTPEPWTLRTAAGEPACHIASAGKHVVANFFVPFAQAKHAVDSRNALAGLNPEAVAGLVKAAKAAFTELNTIKARDGVPWQYPGFKSSVDEDYFGDVVENLSAALARLEGAS